MAAGTVLSVAYLALAISVGPVTVVPRPLHVLGCAAGGLAMWMLIFGIIGLFVSRVASPRPLVRYLSDASYWMYIVHLPVVIAAAGVLAPFALPALVKFGLTLVTTTLVTIVTYHYLVRASAVGVLLNGRRYGRGLPDPEREVRSRPAVA
jgi:peptidoglycan/LPS O-acetylase OafA/YrhL